MVAIKSAGGNGIECIFFQDEGEKMLINNKYVTVGSDNTIVILVNHQTSLDSSPSTNTLDVYVFLLKTVILPI